MTAPTPPAPAYFPVCGMAPYDPAKFADFSSPYTSPTCVGKPIPYPSVFGSTYQLAQQGRADVTSKLCQLQQLFVTTDSGFSNDLGIWEVPTGPKKRGAGKVYIALRQSAVASGNSLAAEENAILAGLLGLSPSLYPPPDPNDLSKAQLPYFVDANASPTSQGAAVLAILAHELGHILLADTNADGAFGGHPRPCDQPSNKCFKDTFFTKSRWDSTKFHGRRWVGFGDQFNNSYLNTQARFVKPTSVNAGNYGAITTMIQQIYSSGEFVSLFAAVSPEEDFIDTYKYKVLADAANAGLNLTLTFPSTSKFAPIDVLKRVRDAEGHAGSAALNDKVGCVGGITQ